MFSIYSIRITGVLKQKNVFLRRVAVIVSKLNLACDYELYDYIFFYYCDCQVDLWVYTILEITVKNAFFQMRPLI